jgi:hypothetical protein
MSHARLRLRLLPQHLYLLAVAACLALAVPAVAGQATVPEETAPIIKRHQQRMLMQKARAKFVRMAEHAEQMRRQMLEEDDTQLTPEERQKLMKKARGASEPLPAREPKKAGWDAKEGGKKVAPERIIRKKPSDDWREPDGAQGSNRALSDERRAKPAAIGGAFVPPPNVLANTRAGDASGAGQCEQDIAAHGSNIVVAWNDGQGFADGTGDTQGYAYSTDGGATFTDGGKLPKPGGFADFIWTSDPLVSVNEATGEFYFLALCSPSANTNGIAIIRGTFSGPTFTWNTPVIIRNESNFTFFLDKPWMVTDSSNGNIYVSYTEFNFSGDEINFRRSTDNGVSWSPDLKMSAPVDDGVYVFWYAIGSVDVDFMKVRRSLNGGASFTSEVIATALYANFGTGAPGFNRDMGIQFPSVAVDRVPGSTNYGRIYLTWNESVNWFNDGLGGAGNISEVEPNNTFAQATAFTPGQRLRGRLVGSDLDYFRFNATQGTTYIFWADSVDSNIDYSMRIFCSDQVTRLALSGAVSVTGSSGFIVWTAPTNATYYLRMASLDAGENSNYRIQTGVNTPGSERGRDHRDVFVSSSNNGGASWSTPSRVNADPALYDNWLPEVEVGLAAGEGRPYVIWYDWRDAASSCGGLSHVYLARSDAAGGNWSELGPISSVQTDWTNVASNISPNQGDYLALYSDMTNLYAAWADGRNADPDVYVSVIPLASTPVLISLANATAESDRVKLAWFSGGDPLASAQVQRRSGREGWHTIATITPDGSDLLHFEDTDVVPGEGYGYRLRIVDNGEERFVGETWVQVPATITFAISTIHPNPTNADAFISFSLPDDAPASLRLLDVAGRTVRDIDVGALGAGSHTVNVGAQGRLPAGVYIVQLTQGGRSANSRLSVVR